VVTKALLGTHVGPTSLRLLDEVRALRQRVAELEAALAAAEATAAAREERESELAAGGDDGVLATGLASTSVPDDREPATA
jgi:hypothetical protein